MTSSVSREQRRGTGAPQDCWDLSGRDVVPDLTARAALTDPGAAFLHAFLSCEDCEWHPPYGDVRSALQVRKKSVEPELQEAADSRLRTWMTYFRALGFVYEDGGAVHVTDAGRRLKALMDDSLAEVDLLGKEIGWSGRWRLARSMVGCLARYQLRNPMTADEYPSDCDMHPLLAIWKVMRALDDKLHWEEFGRVITTCLHMDDLDSAIERIREARTAEDYDPGDKQSMDRHFGPRRPDMGDDGDQRDRIIVWLSRAAFKDLFMELRTRSDGYRYLRSEFTPLLDEVLQNPPPYREFETNAEYSEWVGGAPPHAGPQGTDSDASLRNFVRQCARHGAASVIALVGPAGVGKTRTAHEAAQILTDGDPSRFEFIQFHAAFTYEEFIGGLAPTADGGFSPTEGVFVRFNRAASSDPDRTYVLVIDELSRADVANVLGELLTYVEYRDRSFSVAGLDGKLQVARNLLVIATMNEKDRSVINMDDATIRRLRFFPVEPNPAALSTILDSAGMEEELRSQVVSWFEGLPQDVPFGHGLFVGVSDEKDLHSLWHQQLKYFLARGGITMYPNPAAIEDGYIWRRSPVDDSMISDVSFEVESTESVTALNSDATPPIE